MERMPPGTRRHPPGRSVHRLPAKRKGLVEEDCRAGARRSKLAASVLAGVDNIHIKPGLKVLYLGAASGTSVSHVSDIVGPDGAVYAVEFSHRSGAGRSLCPMVPIGFFWVSSPVRKHVAACTSTCSARR